MERLLRLFSIRQSVNIADRLLSGPRVTFASTPLTENNEITQFSVVQLSVVIV